MISVWMLVRDLKYGYGSHTTDLTDALKALGTEVKIMQGGGDIKTATMKLPDGFDIIHVQGSPFRPFGESKAPLVVTIHTLLKTEAKFGGGSIAARLGQVLERRTLRNADAIILVNTFLENELKEYEEDFAAPKFVIRNGVNLKNFAGVLPRKDFALAVGRDIPRKDFATFREGCALADMKAVEVHGGLTKDQLVALYKTARLFICGSLYETGPITVLEACAARCPVITSDAISRIMAVPNPPWLSFTTGNAESLASAIGKLKGMSQEELDRMTQAEWDYVAEYHDWRKLAAQTVGVYEELL